MIKKHLKPTKENKGGIVSKENFIHCSNVKNIDIQKKEKKWLIKNDTRLKNTYEKEIVSKLMGKLSLKNKHKITENN